MRYSRQSAIDNMSQNKLLILSQSSFPQVKYFQKAKKIWQNCMNWLQAYNRVFISGLKEPVT